MSNRWLIGTALIWAPIAMICGHVGGTLLAVMAHRWLAG